MSPRTLEELMPRGRMGLLAAVAGMGSEDCAAVRRHAEREESRSAFEAAAETYQVAATLEPGEPANWRGLARCLRRLGDTTRAQQAERIAQTMERRLP